MEGPPRWARVTSGSMAPLIRGGDLVLLQKCPPERICFGDIIVFRAPTQWVIHRKIGMRHRSDRLFLLEKPDAGACASLVSSDQVLGRVAYVRREGKNVCLLRGIGKFLQIVLGLRGAASYLGQRVAERWSWLRWLRSLAVRLGQPGRLTEAAVDGVIKWQRVEAQ
ncbi:MAG: signal peptidase I [Anaerolineae bacterium]